MVLPVLCLHLSAFGVSDELCDVTATKSQLH